MPRVKNVGAVMIYADDAGALAQWYATVLGVETSFNEKDGWYEGETAAAGPNDSIHFGIHPAEGERGVMINYEVDNLDDFIAHLAGNNVRVTRTLEEDYGRFAYFNDPEGNPIEIWARRSK